jgi:hypothetical protein
MFLAYALLKLLGGSFGAMVLYPVTLLVTILHELGHALGAVLTGGSVDGLQVNPDGSGYTRTLGGSPGVILMGGYLGSAILGNLMFRIGARHHRLSQGTLLVLAIIMGLAGLVWFESWESTGILWLFSLSLVIIALRSPFDQDVLMFLGLAAVLYIIQDFNVGPSSDLAAYEQVVGIFPAQIWMFIWLGFAAMMFYWNLKDIFQVSR